MAVVFEAMKDFSRSREDPSYVSWNLFSAMHLPAFSAPLLGVLARARAGGGGTIERDSLISELHSTIPVLLQVFPLSCFFPKP